MPIGVPHTPCDISMYMGTDITISPIREIRRTGLRPMRSESDPANGISSIMTNCLTKEIVSTVWYSMPPVPSR